MAGVDLGRDPDEPLHQDTGIDSKRAAKPGQGVGSGDPFAPLKLADGGAQKKPRIFMVAPSRTST